MSEPENEYLSNQKANILNKLHIIEKRMPDFCKSFLSYYLSVKNAQPRTVLGYASDLDIFFYFLQQYNPSITDIKKITLEVMNNLTMQDIQEYMEFLESYTKDGKRHQNSGTGRARKLASLRSLYKYLQGMGMVKNNPTSLIPTPKLKKKNVIMMENNELEDFLDNVEDGTTLSAAQRKISAQTTERDIAIVTLLLHTGLRISELVGIDLDDVDLKNRSIRVIRKGGNEDYVYFDDETAYALQSYIDNERPDTGDMALFISRKHNRMSVRAVEYMIKKYAVVIPNKKITPHKLRSTFATHLYRETGDVYLVKEALSHKSINATMHYTSLGLSKRRSVPELIKEAYNKVAENENNKETQNEKYERE